MKCVVHNTLNNILVLVHVNLGSVYCPWGSVPKYPLFMYYSCYLYAALNHRVKSDINFGMFVFLHFLKPGQTLQPGQ